jgi:hypothetical protein
VPSLLFCSTRDRRLTSSSLNQLMFFMNFHSSHFNNLCCCCVSLYSGWLRAYCTCDDDVSDTLWTRRAATSYHVSTRLLGRSCCPQSSKELNLACLRRKRTPHRWDLVLSETVHLYEVADFKGPRFMVSPCPCEELLGEYSNIEVWANAFKAWNDNAFAPNPYLLDSPCIDITIRTV